MNSQISDMLKIADSLVTQTNQAPKGDETLKSETQNKVEKPDVVEELATKAAEEKIEEKDLKDAVTTLNQYVQTFERKLNFQLDEDSGVTVIKVYDASSEKLIRQIPNEEALSLAQHLNQQDPPQLFSAQV